jgi:hypothetical protein
LRKIRKIKRITVDEREKEISVVIMLYFLENSKLAGFCRRKTRFRTIKIVVLKLKYKSASAKSSRLEKPFADVPKTEF